LEAVTDRIPTQPRTWGKPPISATDLWISVAALTLTVLVGAVGAAGGLFSLAFLDYCPPESCSANGAATAVLGSVLIVSALLAAKGYRVAPQDFANAIVDVDGF
jgi:hypothetical protein